MAEGRTGDAERPEGGRAGGRPLERPTQLPGRSWWAAVNRTVREFQIENLKDGAGLTYYSVLSSPPARADSLD
jgi:membrane protein